MERDDQPAEHVSEKRGAATQAAGDDLVIEREIDLGLDPDELWALVGTGAGWRRWLVDEGDVSISDGGRGRVTDGGIEREVRIDTVDHGRSISFSWWERDDPDSASHVSISVVRRPDGSHGLAVVERVPAARVALTASARAAARDRVRFAWEVRACVAWAGMRTTVTV